MCYHADNGSLELKAVRAGSADLAVVVPEYDMKALHLHQLFKSFPIGPAGQNQVEFFRKVYSEIPGLTRELESNNLHAVLIATGYPAGFSAKKLTNLHEYIIAMNKDVWESLSPEDIEAFTRTETKKLLKFSRHYAGS